ncbi:MAG: hypothetical protein KAI95_16820 [Bacteroidales bacterium]|nr:hypothetical protein [Bacteroidales bacterium]
MKTRTIILIAMLALMAGSCIPSLFPLYTNEDLITDDRIVGTWDAGDGGIWVIERLDYSPSSDFFSSDWSDTKEKNTYKLVVTEIDRVDTLEAEFLVHMLVLGGQHYLNYYPVDYELDHDFMSWHMIEANNFSKVWITEDSISLGFFDPSYLEELIDENRIKISHIRHDNGILLTARTRELQKFVIKYGDEEDAILEPDVFKRI